MLLPALNQAREKARKANCTSNLKQIGLAIAMYADLYGQKIPFTGTVTDVSEDHFALLQNTVQSQRIFVCPSDSRVGIKAAKDWTGNPGGFIEHSATSPHCSYSISHSLTWQDVAADSIVALERVGTTANGAELLNPASVLKGSKWINGNHKSDGGNILFNDGHLEFKNALPSDIRDGSNGTVTPQSNPT